MKRWRFRLIDTGFFRDGTPFAFGETGTLHQNSSFPPFMSTLQGAIRTSLARFQGWEVKEGKKQNHSLIEIWDKKILGDGKMMGQLTLKGPYLEWDHERLYPLPRTILIHHQKHPLEQSKKEPVGWLVPGEVVESDLGKVRLLKSTHPKGKLLEGWVTAKGLERILNQEMPDPTQLFWSDQLWKEEKRIGIRRDYDTHQAIEGNFYTSSHIRPHAKLSIVVDVAGVPPDWCVPSRFTVPLGGEGRFAEVTVSEDRPTPLAFPDFSSAEETIRFTVSLLTPLMITNRRQMRKGPLPDLDCLTASVGRCFYLGGWNLKKKQPSSVATHVSGGEYVVLCSGSINSSNIAIVTWFVYREENSFWMGANLYRKVGGER